MLLICIQILYKMYMYTLLYLILYLYVNIQISKCM